MTDTTKTLPKLRFPEFENDGEWEMQALGNCLLQAPDYGLNAPAVPYSPSLPTYLRITDIDDNGRFITDKKMSVDAEITEKNSLKAGDIVFARTGASVGKVYKYRVEDGSLIFAGFLIRVRPDNSKYCSDYIFQYLFTEAYKRWINITSSRSGQPGINSNEYASLPIPFPSLPEQQKIAEFLTSLDEQISAHTKKLEALKAHKKGLMQQLFPANGEKTPKLRFPEFKNAREWKEVRLGELGDTFPGLSGKDKNDFGHGKAEYITYMNVFSNPIAKKELNQNIEIDTKQHSVQYGDFFFTTSSETPQEVGMSSVWLDNKDNVYLNSFCFGYRLNKLHNFNLIFLSYFFRSYYFRKKMVVLAQGISRYNISKIKVMELPLAFPSLPEQQKIASFLTSIDEMIQAQNDKIRKLKTYKNGFMQQMFPQNK